jgi:hypothetical protein
MTSTIRYRARMRMAATTDGGSLANGRSNFQPVFQEGLLVICVSGYLA